ncbi:MAG: HlyD family secretion protein [Clostridiales bacterium]|nr:HlyD family secretion protein [Clostridiales bacterium]MCF8023361.1 HlyD family secretion protein [Clostridiales bacterium]
MKNKKAFIVIFILMILVLAGVSLYYWYNNTYFVTTKNAKVDADVINVSPEISGEVLELKVGTGDKVEKGQVLARLDDTNLPPGSNMDRTLLRAPIDGMVVHSQVNEGEMALQGKPAVMLINPKDLYITANLEETDLKKVERGQYVEVTIDSIPGKTFDGRVDSFGGAALSEFSLLPSNNASGNFTKVVQRVPVTITLDNYEGHRLWIGTNSVVRIHIK